MAGGFFFLRSFLCVVLSGSAGSCIRHSIQAESPELAGAGSYLSKGSVAQTDLTGSSALIPDRNEKLRADETLSLQASEHKVLRRTKRRWSPLPFNIKENEPPPFPREVELIGSDSSANYSVYYQISGPGVTEPPVGLFTVDPDTGMLSMHRTVNREDHHQFVFIARVYDRRTKEETDRPLPITVNVQDINDNPPVLSGSLSISMPERSSAGTRVGKINVTDTDEPGTLHTKVRFTLLDETDLFRINPETGEVYTKTNSLDREVQDTYLLTVELQDMDGASDGLSTTGTVTIILTDINDNPPTFKEKKHTATVKENTADVLVLRIPVDDKDLEKTPNWNAVYKIKKGNENGNFRMETDPNTNEGLLYVIKPLDHEVSSNVKLEVMAMNEADLVGTKATWATVPVDLTVIDEDEGPEFSAPILSLRVKENVENGTVIGTYVATDPETKSSEGIKYYKMTDIGSWIDVDENTGSLTTLTTLDRESPLVIDSLYNITVKAVDASSKTGTGTVLIQIEDINDNAPVIPAKGMVLCEGGDTSSVLVEAVDSDADPFSGPFSFALPKGHDGKWRLTDVTATSVRLEPAQDLPTGVYSVPLRVEDLQGFGETQTVTVRICHCHGGECPARTSSVSLGAWAILAMLLGLALLLLLCLCCALACTMQREKIYIDDVSTGMLLKSNTEAPGEEVNSSIMVIPASAVDGSVKMGHMNGLATMSSSTLGKQNQVFQEGMAQSAGLQEVSMMDTQNIYSSARYGSGFYGSGKYSSAQYTGTMRSSHAEGYALHEHAGFSSLDTWRTNDLYLQKKLVFLAAEDEGRYADDQPLEFEYEGQGSPAGSVGCCSDQAQDESLEFVDTLGSKFKTLADVCTQE
ncbi:desmocollin 2-like protein [Conger conger]|uniref:desmocollin 2-like protein n=1 Tax=Conger conger TaxID=82655 RepID=UPI002A5A678B|nr:desmocollin 2-like protein [Conger conger]